MRKILLAIAFSVIGAALASAQTTPAPTPPAQQTPPGGRLGTGLPVPRYVSLKTDRVNLREGPSKDHRTAWVFQRAGLPVEIVAEYETWRRIRDSEGTDGWVLHSLLSGRRTALVMPWAKGSPAADPACSTAPRTRAAWSPISSPASSPTSRTCDKGWCRVTIVMDRARDVDGFVQQDKLWGVYPNEKVE